jgi:hypothetical protein
MPESSLVREPAFLLVVREISLLLSREPDSWVYSHTSQDKENPGRSPVFLCYNLLMRIPSSVQGIFFAPVLVCLFFVLKAFCPESAGDECFADQFAVPIFLPLVAVYKIFGDSSIIGGQELTLVLVYWAFIGFLIGLVIDLWPRGEKKIKEPPHYVVAPPPVATPPKPQPVPSIPIIKVQPPPPSKPPMIPVVNVQPPPPKLPTEPIIIPKVSVQPSELVPPKPEPSMTSIPIMKKPPINLLDREEYK